MKTKKNKTHKKQRLSRKTRKTRKTNTKKVCYKYKPKNYIFGYGSLISSNSRYFTGKGFIGEPIPVELKKCMGFKRCWVCKNTKRGKLSFLALKKSKKPKNIRGILYPIYKCMKNFDKREEGYKKKIIKITKINRKKIIKELGLKKLPNYDFNLIIYISNSREGCLSEKCPISQSYLDVVIDGCMEWGENFTKHFLKNTEFKNKNGDTFFKLDRNTLEHDKYKIYNITHKEIDKLLKKYI